jgi:hypothetical protein
MIENLIAAYHIIFERHPHADQIMDQIIDGDRRITVNQFHRWYSEALENK